MSKLLSLIGATAGGYIGWFAGARVSFFTAFVLSVIGTGVGMYIGRRWARNYF